MEATILIATHGDDLWRARGESCWHYHSEHFDRPVIWHHEPDGTLAATRNLCVAIASQELLGGPWLCFVDADDHLEPGYFDAINTAADRWHDGRRDRFQLFAPAIRFGPGSDPMVFRDRNINTMNPCVIGTLIHRAMFDDVGGFWEERAWEDWSLFRRAWIAGAKIHHVPDAIYQAGDSPNGRNSTVKNPQGLHAEIVRSHEAWAREKGYMS